MMTILRLFNRLLASSCDQIKRGYAPGFPSAPTDEVRPEACVERAVLVLVSAVSETFEISFVVRRGFLTKLAVQLAPGSSVGALHHTAAAKGLLNTNSLAFGSTSVGQRC